MSEMTNQAQRQGKMRIFAYIHYIVFFFLGFLSPAISVCLEAFRMAADTKLDVTTGDAALLSLISILELLFLLVPTLLLFVAYVLNSKERGKVGALFALLALVWNMVVRVDTMDISNLHEFAFNNGNLFPGIDFSSMSNIWRFVLEFGLPFLVLAYSVSDGKGRESIAWLMISMFLCGIGVAINGLSLFTAAWIGAHFWMFASFTSKPVHRLTCMFMETGKGSLDKVEPAKFTGAVGEKVKALATILSVAAMCIAFILTVRYMCVENFHAAHLLYSVVFLAGSVFLSWVAGLVMYSIGKTESNAAFLAEAAKQQK